MRRNKSYPLLKSPNELENETNDGYTPHYYNIIPLHNERMKIKIVKRKSDYREQKTSPNPNWFDEYENKELATNINDTEDFEDYDYYEPD